MMKRISVVTLLALVFSAQVNAQENQAKAFDFWIGAWQVSMKVAPKWEEVKGIDSVSYHLAGRLVEERFFLDDKEKPNFQRGYLTYVFRDKQWKHTIYDAKWGEYTFLGKQEGDKVILHSDPNSSRPGKRRETFYNITPDGFDYLWEASYDGGKTWGAEWKVSYKRAK